MFNGFRAILKRALWRDIWIKPKWSKEHSYVKTEGQKKVQSTKAGTRLAKFQKQRRQYG